ncbi:TIGR01777 family oxidoreductase [Candidatus Synchoanobacter obligatus]|uniref:TIGR01777 family oxidoreductase n=1 Tax=Candidatus Synchoanobacter obligatus TaxID=2919597 RepID=A0ABT1L3R4_9GAMM|nr:TIGR01777 family oxidoreductase [Candidatus Synchoanobacter obligatus]MCP8351845.1 TIGR01777 family oxidoreductase [Candidatus Synchoanobacter obligatus]
MNILIFGASGFIGQHLAMALSEHQLTLVSRKSARIQALANQLPHATIQTWDTLADIPLDHIDIVINLCGKSLLGIWTDAFKDELLNSRVTPLNTIATLFGQHNKPPHIICASGVGIYGHQPDNDHLFKESDHAVHPSFLSSLANTCESTLPDNHQKHTCYLRLGAVLDLSGGSLPLMCFPHYFGLGAILGKGTQPFSWVSLSDVIQAFLFAIDQRLTGAYNIVTPIKTTQQDFQKGLAKAMRRPCFIKIPEGIAKHFGQMYQELVLSGQQVSSEKIQQLGFQFKMTEIKGLIRKT